MMVITAMLMMTMIYLCVKFALENVQLYNSYQLMCRLTFWRLYWNPCYFIGEKWWPYRESLLWLTTTASPGTVVAWQVWPAGVYVELSGYHMGSPLTSMAYCGVFLTAHHLEISVSFLQCIVEAILQNYHLRCITLGVNYLVGYCLYKILDTMFRVVLSTTRRLQIISIDI